MNEDKFLCTGCYTAWTSTAFAHFAGELFTNLFVFYVHFKYSPDIMLSRQASHFYRFSRVLNGSRQRTESVLIGRNVRCFSTEVKESESVGLGKNLTNTPEPFAKNLFLGRFDKVIFFYDVFVQYIISSYFVMGCK